jgi:hypothetical protein
MNLFQYREVSMLLIIIFVVVLTAERMSAALRERLVESIPGHNFAGGACSFVQWVHSRRVGVQIAAGRRQNRLSVSPHS